MQIEFYKWKTSYLPSCEYDRCSSLNFSSCKLWCSISTAFSSTTSLACSWSCFLENDVRNKKISIRNKFPESNAEKWTQWVQSLQLWKHAKIRFLKPLNGLLFERASLWNGLLFEMGFFSKWASFWDYFCKVYTGLSKLCLQFQGRASSLRLSPLGLFSRFYCNTYSIQFLKFYLNLKSGSLGCLFQYFTTQMEQNLHLLS